MCPFNLESPKIHVVWAALVLKAQAHPGYDLNLTRDKWKHMEYEK
jgi:hypothetical protein